MGWAVSIVLMLSFGILWIAYSDLKSDYQLEVGENYYDFHSGVRSEFQMMEQILTLEKSLVDGDGDLQAFLEDKNEWIIGISPLVDVGMPETELSKLAEYRSNSIEAIVEFQRTGKISEVKALEENLSAYKQQFQKWAEEVNECAHIGAFCAGYGSGAYQ
ncbi:hypothetical protein [Indiicoccus explosivorum]|uniref:hypothetical protein n=1 Tax=Indiicoccus explosivorum TaxID=1917864 RepID=UPI000B43E937|nr:hypothetical protein [Indiicoccus explosivorum]